MLSSLYWVAQTAMNVQLLAMVFKEFKNWSKLSPVCYLRVCKRCQQNAHSEVLCIYPLVSSLHVYKFVIQKQIRRSMVRCN